MIDVKKEDVSNIIGLLRACTNQKDLHKGSELHGLIQGHIFLEKNCFVASSLITMYARCGALAKAQQVLNKLPDRDVVTWNALIAGYVHHGENEEALNQFNNMQREGHSPTAVTFICALKACGSIGAISIGEKIHDKVTTFGMLDKDVTLGSALLDMYARCGALTRAQKVLDELPVRDVIAWTALIAGYTQQGQGAEALKCFDIMQQEGHRPDVVTFVCSLKACGIIGAAVKGKEIHDKIVSLGILEKKIALANAIVDMYARCGALDKAQQMLDQLPIHHVVMWTALIAGYVQQGQCKEALDCFDSMQCEGHSPDAVAFICALNACASIGAADKGEKIHDEIARLDILKKDIVLGSTLVDMYARCGAVQKAEQVLVELPVRDVVMWTALIAGYVQQEQSEKALRCFDSMQCEGHSPDVVTFSCALKACGSIGVAIKGEKLHEKIAGLGILENNAVLGGSLVDMYARCGELTKAQQVLNKLPVRDVITWTALLAGYVQQGQGEEALKCFDNMQLEGHSPNVVTFTCAVKACGKIAAAVKGEQIHNKIIGLGLLEKDTMLMVHLIDMYAKCGALAKALKVFEDLPIQNIVSWNALIGGFAHLGQSVEAVSYFEKMESKGVVPDSDTLVHVLNACSHCGLLDEAEIYFSKLGSNYGTRLNGEHYSCMVDIFGRAGEFNKAFLVLQKIPFADFLPIWLTLLGACHKWEDVKIGRLAYERVLHLDENETAAYVCMANIYAAAGMQWGAGNIDIIYVDS